MNGFPLFALPALAVNAAAAISLSDPGQEVFDFTADAAELSGLAWVTGTTYYAVSDATNRRLVHELSIAVNPANGRVTKASLARTLTLAAGFDLEGIAWCRPRGTCFVADEGDHPEGGYLREHTLPDGKLVRTFAIPPPLLNDRPNFGLESCTWGAGALWTANEEALAQDGALSSANAGCFIRLQKFKNMGSIATRNFEGLALGAALQLVGSTSFSVLLVADNGGGTLQHLYPLIVSGVVPPSPAGQRPQESLGKPTGKR